MRSDAPRENPPAELVDAYKDKQELAAERAELDASAGQ